MWDPGPIWKGEDAYVVGGGDSLRHFEWDLIRGRNTIGCNSACILGPDIIKVLLFGDMPWWERFGRSLTEDYGGIVVGCTPRIHSDPCPWLLQMRRNNVHGLSTDKLAWAGNTGGMAVNLALILGAVRVFLLGFDMKLGGNGRSNWHDVRDNPEKPDVYPRFIKGFRHIARSLPDVFPGRDVINLTDDSDLPYFPRVSVMDHFNSLRKEE